MSGELEGREWEMDGNTFGVDVGEGGVSVSIVGRSGEAWDYLTPAQAREVAAHLTACADQAEGVGA